MKNSPLLEWHKNQIILSDFVVLRELGEGGMGKVYLLKSRSTGMEFAVKRAKGLSDNERRNFLVELQTWIDLPDHPNLVPCRFFRTIGDEIIIFAEYVQGGSLKDWISSRKLYEGGKEIALERMLDIAIQMAWGLHCLHGLGLIHQDVKPANMLISQNKQIAFQGLNTRVSDYGLARGRATIVNQYISDIRNSILVSSGGYTPAYCSPEQKDSRKLDLGTDLWSWGVSVLEMFQGGVTWQSGKFALEALETYLEHKDEENDIPEMPNELVVALRDCFQKNSSARWSSEELTNWMKDVYENSFSKEYSGCFVEIKKSAVRTAGDNMRRTPSGATWKDPRDWLEKVLLAEGRSPSDANDIILKKVSSRRGQLVADIALYNEALHRYKRLIIQGRKELETELSGLYHEAAFVHEAAGDLHGAIEMNNRAIEIRERLVSFKGRDDMTFRLAIVYQNKALLFKKLGDNRTAANIYSSAIEILLKLIKVDGRKDVSNQLAMVYLNKANALFNIGETRSAIDLYDRAIEIRERLVNIEGRNELSDDLATVYRGKAYAVTILGENRVALDLAIRAIEILERLVRSEGRRELNNGLAIVYMTKGNAAMNLGDNRSAVESYDQAINILEHSVNFDGLREQSNDLATVYLNKANAIKNLGDNRTAISLYNRAIEIRERLVNIEGRNDLSNDLAMLYLNKGIAVSILGQYSLASELYDQAIKIRERLVNIEGRYDLAEDLAFVYLSKGIAVMNMGDNDGAITLYNHSISIREKLVNNEGRIEFANNLASTYMSKANALRNIGDNTKAITLYDEVISIRENLINRDGRKELFNDLAMAFMNKGNALTSLGRNLEALEIYNKAIEIRERLVFTDKRQEFLGSLARSYAILGVLIFNNISKKDGRDKILAAKKLLENEISRTGAADLKQVLAWVENQVK